VLISKPPAAAIARLVLDRVARSQKPFTICFLGAAKLALPPNARGAATLAVAAELALGRPVAAGRAEPPALRPDRGRQVLGLYAGGTLCAEAQLVFREAGLAVASNVPVPGAAALADAGGAHAMIDLGDDGYTRGRPHPMIDPVVRDGPLVEALADPAVGLILLDIVLGFGAHPDPAGHLVGVIAGRNGPPIIASVTGTDADPQPRDAQVQKLVEAGVIVADSNAEAAELAVMAVGKGEP
jgi:FdrA protein